MILVGDLWWASWDITSQARWGQSLSIWGESFNSQKICMGLDFQSEGWEITFNLQQILHITVPSLFSLCWSYHQEQVVLSTGGASVLPYRKLRTGKRNFQSSRAILLSCCQLIFQEFQVTVDSNNRYTVLKAVFLEHNCILGL